MPSFEFCRHLCTGQNLTRFFFFLSAIQNSIVPASYWHDPIDEDAYRGGSQFIAEYNNEKLINEEYIKNLQSLNKLVMVKFSNDEAVEPNESAWFGYYKSGQDVHVVPMNETSVYIKVIFIQDSIPIDIANTFYGWTSNSND